MNRTLQRWLPNKKNIVKDAAITIGLLLSATVISDVFIKIANNTDNISGIYILTVLFVALYTEGYFWGLLTSVVSVVAINYFFTYPYFAINFSLSGYPLTFLIMLSSGIIVSTLATSTKEKRILAEEKQRISSEKQNEQMRSNLLRAISHDLRTPLTGIIGASSTILENKELISKESHDRLIKDIHEDSQWLLRMVENILSVTRIDKNTSKLLKSIEPVEEIVAQSVKRCQKRFPDVKFNVSVPHEFIMAPMDGTLIEQVLINLIENAIKHGGNNLQVDITVYKAGDFVYFAVRDYGQGVPQQDIEKIFNEMYMGNHENSDATRGFGLGLPICKTIVTAHSGKIWCNNNLDQGATFTFTLPMEGDGSWCQKE